MFVSEDRTPNGLAPTDNMPTNESRRRPANTLALVIATILGAAFAIYMLFIMYGMLAAQ